MTGSSQVSESGRPNRPPPPPRRDESDSSTLESILLSSGVDESSTDALISQIIDTIQELSADASGSISVEDFQSALTSVLEENGVDVDTFKQQLASNFDLGGLFLNRLTQAINDLGSKHPSINDLEAQRQTIESQIEFWSSPMETLLTVDDRDLRVMVMELMIRVDGVEAQARENQKRARITQRAQSQQSPSRGSGRPGPRSGPPVGTQPAGPPPRR